MAQDGDTVQHTLSFMLHPELLAFATAAFGSPEFVVDDASIAAATRWYADRAKLVVETSGAVTLAALQSGIVPTGEGVTVAVVSGGNVSLDTLHSLPD